MPISTELISNPYLISGGSAITMATNSGTSIPVALNNHTPCHLITSGTAYTAGTVGFLVSQDGGATYYPLYDKTNAQYTVVISAGRSYALDVTMFLGYSHVKLVNVPASTTEAADRAYIMGVRPI